MTLAAGTRLGAHEILGPLGAGGMGEVYRARDTKLNRDVAIKTLPAALALDPDRLARFRREAQVLASLNHPNIGHIYGFEESDGVQALVLEFVDGSTLADRIAQGPIPLDEALLIARRIAEALEAAHDQGIVHRDLKPANIKLRPDGAVKVLDFGLAKALDRSSVGAHVSQSPTITTPAMTQMGVILGTAAYMSPEQAKGRVADKRSDIWAFGCVLFEMLTAHRVFEGEDVADTLAFVLTKEPAWNSLPADTPPSIRRLLRRCLEKDRTRRLADIADARLELDERGTAEAAQLLQSHTSTPLRRWLPWSIAAVSLAAALWLAGTTGFDRPAEDTRVYRSSILLPGRLGNPRGISPGANVSFSPDGRRLAFATIDKGRQQLWIRSLDGPAARPIADTDDAISPFWSPDSRWLAFVANGKLKKIDPSGGPAVTLCESALSGGTWNRDDVILFTNSARSLAGVRAIGGAPSTLTALDAKADEFSHNHPFFLPDGRHFVYVVVGRWAVDQSAVYVASLDSSERTRLPVDGRFVQYARGFLLFVRGRTLLAQRFDAERRMLVGDAVPIAEQLRVDSTQAAFFTVSPTGTLVFQEDPSPGYELTWYDREGRPTGTLGEAGDYTDLNLSPDGLRALVSVAERDLWIFDVPRGLRTRFTFNPAAETHNIWSPDGSRVVFGSHRKGHFDLYQKRSDGVGDEEVLLEDEFDKIPWTWSPDGRFILYARRSGPVSDRSGYWVLPLEGDRKSFRFTPTTNAVGATFSPDGRWVAYGSDESGRREVYVSPFPGPGAKTLVSTAGGTDPRWRRGGREIFYLSPDNKLMAAAVTVGRDRVEVGEVKPLFDLLKVGQRSAYDVSPDGQRILAVTDKAESAAAPLTLVVNWPELLKK